MNIAGGIFGVLVILIYLGLFILFITLAVRLVRALEGMARAQRDTAQAVRELVINFRKSKEENR